VEISVDSFAASHIHIPGAARTGKSKFIEYLIRQHIARGEGCCLIDWHGTTYQAVLEWLAMYDMPLPVLPIDLSNGKLGINPFKLRGDVAAQASRLVSAIANVFGTTSMEAPRFRRVGGLLLRYILQTATPPHEAICLLDFPEKSKRQLASRKVGGRDGAEWLDLNTRTASQWSLEVESTKNRIGDIVRSPMYRFLQGDIDLREAMDEGYFVLINLRQSDTVDEQSARDFAALVFSEFTYQAMNRKNTEPYRLYLDEAQAYLPPSAANMLDQLLKFGLSLGIAHHNMSQFPDPHLRMSIHQQCRLKAVFGGMDVHSAYEMAELLFPSELNGLEIKDQQVRLINRLKPTERKSITTSGERVSETVSQGFETEQEEDVQNTYYSRDEKIHFWVERLMRLPQRRCFVQYGRAKTFELETPYVVPAHISTEQVNDYIISLFPGPERSVITPPHDEEDFTGHAENK
jgi:hypothetical protein